MDFKEIIDQLTEKKRALQESLMHTQASITQIDEAIRLLSNDLKPIKTVESKINYLPEPITDKLLLGNLRWSTYIYKILERLGEKETVAIIDYVLKANPNIDKKTAAKAVRNNLTTLKKAQRIQATPLGNTPTDGYKWKIKSPDNIEAK